MTYSFEQGTLKTFNVFLFLCHLIFIACFINFGSKCWKGGGGVKPTKNVLCSVFNSIDIVFQLCNSYTLAQKKIPFYSKMDLCLNKQYYVSLPISYMEIKGVFVRTVKEN